jgi:hypothetical protein
MPQYKMRDHPTEDVGKSPDNRVLNVRGQLPLKRVLKRPKDMRPAAAPKYLVRCGDLMLTEKHASGIAAEVSAALISLLDHNPEIVMRFEETFYQRSKMAGVVESHLGCKGIKGAFAELLPSTFKIYSPSKSDVYGKPNPGFVNDCQCAIVLLAEQNPLALLMLKKHQVEQNCTLEEALQALFSDYWQRAAVYPY